MITTIIAWIYITFLSFTWGKLFFRLTAKGLSINQINDIHFSIICCCGIITITTIAAILSFFLPLGGVYIQLLFLIPSLFSLKEIFRKKNSYLKRLLLPLPMLLLICYIIVALLMSTWIISHPDSITYHIQIIKWIEDYKVVPGIANLNARFGFQSIWFIACAVFNLKFTGAGSYIYLNSLVTIWFVYFIVSTINHLILSRRFKESLLWVCLFILSFCSYTQLPLTTSSASPDFITCLCIWASFYLVYDYQKKMEEASLITAILFSMFAFCIKLSGAPVIIITIYAFVKLTLNKKYKSGILSLIVATVMLACFTTRSAITSGYIFYPSVVPDVVNVDWKVEKKNAQREAWYVTAFAKSESEESDEAIASTNKMKMQEWIPVWWQHRSTADSIIILLVGLSMLYIILDFKYLRKQNTAIVLLVLTSFCGTFFWFFLAPDPRFGFGFLITLLALAASMLVQKNTFTFYSKAVVSFTLAIVSLVLLAYSGYRLKYYFTSKQFVYPLGIEKKTVTIVPCEGNKFNLAQPYQGCGDNDIPCIEDSCKKFSLRGPGISDGFKPKTK